MEQRGLQRRLAETIVDDADGRLIRQRAGAEGARMRDVVGFEDTPTEESTFHLRRFLIGGDRVHRLKHCQNGSRALAGRQ